MRFSYSSKSFYTLFKCADISITTEHMPTYEFVILLKAYVFPAKQQAVTYVLIAVYFAVTKISGHIQTKRQKKALMFWKARIRAGKY